MGEHKGAVSSRAVRPYICISPATAVHASLIRWGLPVTESPDFRKERYEQLQPSELQRQLNFKIAPGITTFIHPSIKGQEFSEGEIHYAITAVMESDSAIFQKDHQQPPEVIKSGLGDFISGLPGFISATRNKNRKAQMAIALMAILETRVPAPAPEAVPAELPEEEEKLPITQRVVIPQLFPRPPSVTTPSIPEPISGEIESVRLRSAAHDAIELSIELDKSLGAILVLLSKVPDDMRQDLSVASDPAFKRAYRKNWSEYKDGKDELLEQHPSLAAFGDAVVSYENTLRKLGSNQREKRYCDIEREALKVPSKKDMSKEAIDIISASELLRVYYGDFTAPSFLESIAQAQCISMMTGLSPHDAAQIAARKMPGNVAPTISGAQDTLRNDRKAEYLRSSPRMDPAKAAREADIDISNAFILVKTFVYYQHAPASGQIKIDWAIVGQINRMAAILDADPKLTAGQAAIQVVGELRQARARVESITLQPSLTEPLSHILHSYSREAVVAFAERMTESGIEAEPPANMAVFDSELERILPESDDEASSKVRMAARVLNFHAYLLSTEEERRARWPIQAQDERPAARRQRAPQHGWAIGSFPAFTAYPLSVARLLDPDGQALDAKTQKLSNKAINSHDEFIKGLRTEYPEPFAIKHSIDICGTMVHVGSPMVFDKYEAIPVYIQMSDDLPRLIFAYKSKSQDSWRRYAGYLAGIFWKGDSEHLQNFDWRIQRVLDLAHESSAPVDVMRNKKPISLPDISIGAASVGNEEFSQSLIMIQQLEASLQNEMKEGQEEFDIKDSSNAPDRIISYWWGGDVEGAYGRYVNIVAFSENSKYLYVFALTEDGLFLKYVQPAQDDGVNCSGAPLRGVPVSKKNRWIYAPIVEYNSQTEDVRKNGNEDAKVEGTIMFGGNRARIIGAHETDASPFYRFNNGVEEISRLLRSGNTGAVEKRMGMIMKNGMLPQETDHGTRPYGKTVVADIQMRFENLRRAFGLFAERGPGMQAHLRQQLMADYRLTERDMATFKRYLLHIDQLKEQASNPKDPFAKSYYTQRFLDGLLDRKLSRMAERWAQDLNMRTILMERED